MPTRLVVVAFDAREPTAVARFWAELLGRDVVDEKDGVLLPGPLSIAIPSAVVTRAVVGDASIDQPTTRRE